MSYHEDRYLEYLGERDGQIGGPAWAGTDHDYSSPTRPEAYSTNPDRATFDQAVTALFPHAHEVTQRLIRREHTRRQQLASRLADAFEPITWKRRRF